MKYLKGYGRKLRVYLAPTYWMRVVAVHGLSGIPRDVARIVSPSKKTHSAATDRPARDFTNQTDHPGEALRLAREVGPDVVARVAVPMGSLRRNHLGVSVSDRKANPFTSSVAEYLSGRHRLYTGSAIESFFARWQPSTLAEFVGVEVGENSGLTRPLILGLLPWEPYLSPEQLLRQREASELDRMAKFGPAPEGKHGFDYFGPTSHALGSYRHNKHCRVAQSIRDEGFDNDDHAIDVQVLEGESEDTWALLVLDGKHRTTALAALGHASVVVSLPPDFPVIRRVDVENWPGVAHGLYRVDEALQVFDRFLVGSPAYSSVAIS